MRLIFSLITLASLGFGGWYAWENVTPIRQTVRTALNSSEFQTLEIRFSAEEIMHTYKEQLLKSSGYSYLEPKLMFHPYLLMDVKYSKDQTSTSESSLLWGLSDGEMVIDSSTWEKTHGFEDCLISKATKNDFKVLKTIVDNGGSIDREKLYQRFKVDSDTVDEWVDSCREKKLIVTSGNRFRLHFQNPRIQSLPTTKIGQALVSQPTKYTNKVKGRYTASQIKKLSKIAFGNDYAIRRTQEVFLPVYSIAIQNPDGSVLTTYWNALNGHRLSTSNCR